MQIGFVAAAVTAAEQCKPDAICVQGINAAGDSFENGASIISLLPETTDAITTVGYGGIPLLVVGGIAESRRAGRALALGAQGVVLCTRFLSASETAVHRENGQAIFFADEGIQTTVRDKLFDSIHGHNIWPAPYDWRRLVTDSFLDYAGGVSVEEVRKRYAGRGT